MGGCTASHNKGGPYFRRRAVPTDPASMYQTTVRNAMATLSSAWVNELTPSERMAWDTYAQNVSWVDSLGQAIQLSGLNHYLRCNSVRHQAKFWADAGYANFVAATRGDVAPADYTLGPPFIAGASSLVLAVGVATLTVANATLPAPVLGSLLYGFVSPPQNPSVEFFKGPYLSVYAGLGGDPFGAILSDAGDCPYVLRYGPLTIGQKVFWRTRLQWDDDRLSNDTTGFVIVS